MANKSKGLVIIYTGEGKGKTSAAFGSVFRALGHGWRVLVIQFLKGKAAFLSGENESAKSHPKLRLIPLGEGFVKICGDKKPIAKHREAALEALKIASMEIQSGKYDLVVLDEINCALDICGESLIPVKDVIDLIKSKPSKTHLILTGRNAKKELIALADVVTEMKQIKHPYKKGILAQKGIDF